MKVLNLYAGIGGNRKLWENVDVTAVEWEPKIAEIYQDFFPEDTVIVADAHQYLLEYYKEYDFIWSSPPCPTHSFLHRNFANMKGRRPEYPDMRLYQEIILLDTFFDGKYCVENVRSYYDPLIKPQELHRHYFWANFLITPIKIDVEGVTVTNARSSVRRSKQEHLEMLKDLHGFDVDDVKMLSNCVFPPLGKHILNCARGNTQLELTAFSKSKRNEQ